MLRNSLWNNAKGTGDHLRIDVLIGVNSRKVRQTGSEKGSEVWFPRPQLPAEDSLVPTAADMAAGRGHKKIGSQDAS